MGLSETKDFRQHTHLRQHKLLGQSKDTFDLAIQFSNVLKHGICKFLQNGFTPTVRSRSSNSALPKLSFEEGGRDRWECCSLLPRTFPKLVPSDLLLEGEGWERPLT